MISEGLTVFIWRVKLNQHV